MSLYVKTAEIEKAARSDTKAGQIKVWRSDDLAQIELHRGFSVARPVRRHWHDEYQLCLVESGSGALIYRGRDFPTPPASLFIVQPGEVHSNRASDISGCSYRTMFLDPELMRNIATEARRRMQELPFFPTTVIFDRDLIEQFTNLHIALERPLSRLAGQILLQNFLLELLGRFAEDRIATRSFGAERKAIGQACDYLVANYATNISLDKLASIAKLSQFHFNRVFSQQFGMPPHAFQTQVRISKAKQLLRKGGPISQVACEIGFADQSHLNRHFKRLTGITPRQFKQSSKNVQEK